MKCPLCQKILRKVKVAIEGAAHKAICHQCSCCDYVKFEPESSSQILQELKKKETPLNIKQKIVKLSSNRLGIYFNRNVIRSLNLKAGENILVSVPDKNHIILNLKKIL